MITIEYIVRVKLALIARPKKISINTFLFA